MGANSRTKGSTFERDIARELEAVTGVSFKRNLEQSRAADHGDLVPDNPAFPFLIECKRYAQGQTCQTPWKDQATKAAAACGKIPAVVFKFDRLPIRVAVPLSCLCEGAGPNEWAELSMSGLCYVAQEMMATHV